MFYRRSSESGTNEDSTTVGAWKDQVCLQMESKVQGKTWKLIDLLQNLCKFKEFNHNITQQHL